MSKRFPLLVALGLVTVGLTACFDFRGHHRQGGGMGPGMMRGGGMGSGMMWGGGMGAAPGTGGNVPIQGEVLPPDPGAVGRARVTFRANCVACHGPEGRGDGPAGAGLMPPPANLTTLARRFPNAYFAARITNGRGAMPAFRGVLSEAQIWDLTHYIQNL